MNFNIDYLMQHISYELQTIVKNWTDTLSSQTKPEVVCTRKDISDEYLPFSVFTDYGPEAHWSRNNKNCSRR